MALKLEKFNSTRPRRIPKKSLRWISPSYWHQWDPIWWIESLADERHFQGWAWWKLHQQRGQQEWLYLPGLLRPRLYLIRAEEGNPSGDPPRRAPPCRELPGQLTGADASRSRQSRQELHAWESGLILSGCQVYRTIKCYSDLPLRPVGPCLNLRWNARHDDLWWPLSPTISWKELS